MQLEQNGATATLSGRIDTGDDRLFSQFLAHAGAGGLKTIYLNSRGGLVDVGLNIARQIRAAHLGTALNATSARCDSACTLLFAGGVQRYYINGDQVFEGFSSMTGLGFHVAHVKGDATHRSEKSDAGTERMLQFYREMGQPAAAEMAQMAPYDTLFRPNGKTALADHICTSLAPPPN